MQSSLSTIAHTSREHDVADKFRPFDYQPTFVHIFFLPADQTRSFWCLTEGFRKKSCFHQ